MLTVILAKHGTKERVVCQINSKTEIGALKEQLDLRLGGYWVYVQDLLIYDAIPFAAAKPYLGFDGNPEKDYCGNLIKLR